MAIAFLVLLAVVALVVAASAMRTIPQSHVGVIQRMGRFQATHEAGTILMLPGIDRMELVDMRERTLSIPQKLTTRDNQTVDVRISLFYQVMDARLATYEVADLPRALEELATATVSHDINALPAAEVPGSAADIQGRLKAVLNEAAGRWGVRVNQAELRI